MKQLKQIIQEKLIINKNSKIKKDSTYEFLDKSSSPELKLKINMPFSFYFPNIHEEVQIDKIKESQNSYEEPCWDFFIVRDNQEYKVVTLSKTGIINVFIKGPQSNFAHAKPSPAITYITYGNDKQIKKVNRSLLIELSNPYKVIIDESKINEKLIINKSSKIKQYNYYPTNTPDLKSIIDKKLWKDGNQDANLNDIDVSKITDMSGLFFREFPHNINISEWDVSNVEDMSNMFWNNSDFDCDLSKWDVRNVRHMRYMFRNCKNFKGKGLDKWQPINCTDFYGMFEGTPIENNPPKWYKK